MSRAAALTALLLVFAATSSAAPASAGNPPGDVVIEATVVYDGGDAVREPLPGSVFQFTPVTTDDPPPPATAGIAGGAGSGTIAVEPGEYAVSAVGPQRMGDALANGCDWHVTFVTGAALTEGGEFVISVAERGGGDPVAVTIGLTDRPQADAASPGGCFEAPVQAPRAGQLEAPRPLELPDAISGQASSGGVDLLWVSAVAGSAVLVAGLIVALVVAARRRT